MLDYLCLAMNLGWYEHMWKGRLITSSIMLMCAKLFHKYTVKLLNNFHHLTRA